MRDDIFSPWIKRWNLVRDGASIVTDFGNHLLPVISYSAPAMLKIAVAEEEIRGAELLEWYGGAGAAAVLAREGEALLMERALGARDLAQMARSGEDDAASTALCACASRLHAPRALSPPSFLTPLDIWFRALFPRAEGDHGTFAKAAAAAQELLAAPRDIVALHGDLHHGNVLDGCERGWLAIDPKGLVGERTFEFVNLLRNPDTELALKPRRMERQVSTITNEARVESKRLLHWTLAYAGLSAAWCLEDGEDARPDLAIAEMAAAELGV